MNFRNAVKVIGASLVLALALTRGTVVGAVELAVDIRAEQKIDYSLAYPGMLPDHPLYFLKVFRDQVVLILIRDEKDKGFFYLLQADKRIAAAEKLFSLRKDKVAGVTVAQGMEYYEKAVEIGVRTKDSNLVPKLAVAGAKHNEILQELERKAGKEEKEILGKALRDNEKQRNRIREVIIKE